MGPAVAADISAAVVAVLAVVHLALLLPSGPALKLRLLLGLLYQVIASTSHRAVDRKEVGATVAIPATRTRRKKEIPDKVGSP